MTSVIAVLGAAAFLIFGLWPFFGPQSFYDQLAEFPPYNAHFLHDIGAFQVGIGVSLVLAMWRRRDALLAALGGAGAASALHAVAHVRDHGLGGKDSDPYVFAFLAVLLLGAALMKLRAPEA
ncbi:MAG: hypothetical protein ABI577_13880 [bacterium]